MKLSFVRQWNAKLVTFFKPLTIDPGPLKPAILVFLFNVISKDEIEFVMFIPRIAAILLMMFTLSFCKLSKIKSISSSNS